jgi:DNA-binding transcriptional MerR regulator
MEQETCTSGKAAKKVGVSIQTLHTWIETGKIQSPLSVPVGKTFMLLWTEADIDRARKFKGTSKRGPKPKKK